jgi:hypothetical protein
MEQVTQVAEPLKRNKIVVQRTRYDVFKDPVYFDKNEDSNDYNGKNRTHDMPPQCLKVVNKRHFRIFAILPEPVKEIYSHR